ncbi:MAG TPA: hypothetical protein VLD59_09615 [Steroidobacteraceae bacterium]|nr:hypothetical protein [Steroidobacteraceae bacterium]
MVAGALTGAMLALSVTRAAADPESTSESKQPVTVSSDRELESVTVEAQRERITKQVSQFVTSIVLPARHESLARWQVPICLGVAGLPPTGNEFVKKRISQIAADSGVPLGSQGCAFNFVVVVTSDPETLLKEWWAADPRLFNRDRGVGGVKRLISAELPVRVWYNACSVAPGLAKHFEMSGYARCNTGELGSRLTWGSVRTIYSVIEVVDLEHIVGLTYGQVADYVSMVGLAQIRENPELGDAPTILGLFAQGSADRPEALSHFDQAFLRSVYESTVGNVTELAQIKLRMGQDLLR